MPDPVNPAPPSPSNSLPAPVAAPSSKFTGLPPNIAAALACIPLFGGLVFFILEKEDRFVRFYAMQSIIFGAICFVLVALSHTLGTIAWSIPVANIFFGPLWSFLFAVVKLALVVLMIIAMVKAFTGVRWEMPVVGSMARKQVGDA
jgi:uncharacterized membrane protein